MTCTDCGMKLNSAGEFHPYAFCVLFKARLDPWQTLKELNGWLGDDVSHWPSKPPLVRWLDNERRAV